MPQWVVDEAQNLTCQACVDAKRGEQLVLPVSVGIKREPWQFDGIDVFELPFYELKVKARFLIMIDLTTRFQAVEVLWSGKMNEAGTDPGVRFMEVFASTWLQRRPRPEWVLCDPQTSLAYGDFPEFLSSTGIGLSVTPGEAHWQLGGVEEAVKATKKTMKKIRSQEPNLPPSVVGKHILKVKGFTPVQWAYGVDPAHHERDELALDPLKVNKEIMEKPANFWNVQQLRDKAEEAAREAFTRLHNAAPRPANNFQLGDWVCVWRTATLKIRKRRVNPEPRFIGPGRVALIEPAVLPAFWALLWRCAPELCFALEQEVVTELQAVLRPVNEQLRMLLRWTDVTTEGQRMDEDERLDLPLPIGAPQVEWSLTSAQPPSEWVRGIEEAADTWADRLRAREGRLSKEQKSRSRERHQQVTRWRQLQAILNANRRRDGLASLTKLPPLSVPTPDTWEVDDEARVLIRRRNKAVRSSENMSLPIQVGRLTGKRVTQWMHAGNGAKGSFICLRAKLGQCLSTYLSLRAIGPIKGTSTWPFSIGWAWAGTWKAREGRAVKEGHLL